MVGAAGLIAGSGLNHDSKQGLAVTRALALKSEQLALFSLRQ